MSDEGEMYIPPPPQKELEEPGQEPECALDSSLDIDVDKMYGSPEEPLYAISNEEGKLIPGAYHHEVDWLDNDSFEDSSGFDDAIEFDD